VTDLGFTPDEAMDLYLRILQRAQEVEDRRLVRMILARLREAPPLLSPAETSNVIPFPAPRGMVGCHGAGDPPFWPRMAVAQILVMLGGYLLVVMGHFMLG